MSLWLGCGLPEGWLCRSIIPAALFSKALRMTVLLSMDVCVSVPIDTISFVMTVLSLARNMHQTSSWSSPERLSCRTLSAGMLTSDDSDPVHYLYLDRLYAIKSGQYYRQQPALIHPVFSVESDGKSVPVVEDTLFGRYILQGEFYQGDEITVHISGDGVSEVSSTTTIPEPPTKDNIENLFIKETSIDGGIVVISTYRVSFSLNGDDAYYGLSFVLGDGPEAYD